MIMTHPSTVLLVLVLASFTVKLTESAHVFDENIAPNSRIVVANDDNWDSVIGRSPVALVMFSAPWCDICKNMTKMLRDVAWRVTGEGATVAVIDGSSTKETYEKMLEKRREELGEKESDQPPYVGGLKKAREFKVDSFPTFKVFHYGRFNTHLTALPRDENGLSTILLSYAAPAVTEIDSVEDVRRVIEEQASIMPIVIGYYPNGPQAGSFRTLATSFRGLVRFYHVPHEEIMAELGHINTFVIHKQRYRHGEPLFQQHILDHDTEHHQERSRSPQAEYEKIKRLAKIEKIRAKHGRVIERAMDWTNPERAVQEPEIDPHEDAHDLSKKEEIEEFRVAHGFYGELQVDFVKRFPEWVLDQDMGRPHDYAKWKRPEKPKKRGTSADDYHQMQLEELERNKHGSHVTRRLEEEAARRVHDENGKVVPHKVIKDFNFMEANHHRENVTRFVSFHALAPIDVLSFHNRAALNARTPATVLIFTREAEAETARALREKHHVSYRSLGDERSILLSLPGEVRYLSNRLQSVAQKHDNYTFLFLDCVDSRQIFDMFGFDYEAYERRATNLIGVLSGERKHRYPFKKFDPLLIEQWLLQINNGQEEGFVHSMRAPPHQPPHGSGEPKRLVLDNFDELVVEDRKRDSFILFASEAELSIRALENTLRLAAAEKGNKKVMFGVLDGQANDPPRNFGFSALPTIFMVNASMKQSGIIEPEVYQGDYSVVSLAGFLSKHATQPLLNTIISDARAAREERKQKQRPEQGGEAEEDDDLIIDEDTPSPGEAKKKPVINSRYKRDDGSTKKEPERMGGSTKFVFKDKKNKRN